MVVMEQAIEHGRLRAPRADGGILIHPPVAAVGDLLARNAATISAAEADIGGRRLADVARDAREELLAEALAYTRQYRHVAKSPDASAPVLIAGHQPQLFHPGVWFKNFALSALAEMHGGTAVNLVIDSDTIKTASVRVPYGTAERPQVESVAFDRASAEIPYEERTVLDCGCLRSFGERAAKRIESLIPNPLLREFWPLVSERATCGANLGESLSQARHIQEGFWGAVSLELPQSRVCALPSFDLFTCHLLAHLPRLQEVYNGAVAEYRRTNHVRSLAHPVPDLASEDGWLEAPYWIWSRENPRRRRLFVRREGNELILSDRADVHVHLTLPAHCDAAQAAAQLAELRQSGIKLRTRALITTLFARLLLGDLFIHGIGGAKYDQVTDLLIARFFGVEPNGYLTVTATLKLPIPHPSVTLEDRRLIDARLRELCYHPERYAEAGPEDRQANEWIEAKQRWVATPQTPENARTRCRAIRQVNEALQPWVARMRSQLEEERGRLEAALRAEALLASREYAFCLYPADRLRQLMGSLGNA